MYIIIINRQCTVPAIFIRVKLYKIFSNRTNTHSCTCSHSRFLLVVGVRRSKVMCLIALQFFSSIQWTHRGCLLELKIMLQGGASWTWSLTSTTAEIELHIIIIICNMYSICTWKAIKLGIKIMLQGGALWTWSLEQYFESCTLYRTFHLKPAKFFTTGQISLKVLPKCFYLYAFKQKFQ